MYLGFVDNIFNQICRTPLQCVAILKCINGQLIPTYLAEIAAEHITGKARANLESDSGNFVMGIVLTNF